MDEQGINKKYLYIGGAVALIVALIIAWNLTNGFGTTGSGKLDNEKQVSQEQEGGADNNGYAVDQAEKGPADLPAYKRKDIPAPRFEGLNDKDANAVILNFLNVVYNTDTSATDSPQANALQAKGLMTQALALKMEAADKAEGPSSRWLNWGEKGVKLRAQFTLNAKDFPRDSTTCPKTSSGDEGRCDFTDGGEETNSTANSVQRIIIVNQEKSAGNVDVKPSKIVVRITAVDEGNGWRVSTMNSEVI